MVEGPAISDKRSVVSLRFEMDPPPKNFHKIVLDQLSEILVRINVLEHQLVDRIVEKRLRAVDECTRTTELNNRKLTAEEKQAIDDLEFDLANSEVMQTMVIYLHDMFQNDAFHISNEYN